MKKTTRTRIAAGTALTALAIVGLGGQAAQAFNQKAPVADADIYSSTAGAYQLTAGPDNKYDGNGNKIFDDNGKLTLPSPNWQGRCYAFIPTDQLSAWAGYAGSWEGVQCPPGQTGGFVTLPPAP